MLDPSDGNPYGIDLANALHDAGLDVTLFVAARAMHMGRIRCANKAIAPRSGRGMYAVKAIEEARYLAGISWRTLTRKPSILHVQWMRFRQELALLRAVRAAGVRVIVTAHNPLPHERYVGDVAHYRALYGAANRVIVHEESARSTLIDTLKICPGVIDVIPHGVATGVSNPTNQAKARSVLGIAEGAPTFMFFGGLRPYKGYDLLLEAFGEAAVIAPHIELIIAGWGTRDAVRHVRERVASFDGVVRRRIHDLLSEDHPCPLDSADLALQATDCVVLPYYAISQSGVLWHAFSSARPVLASAVGGLSEVVRDGFNGRLVPPGDANALKSALVELSQDRSKLLEWGNSAKRWALESYSWDAIARKTISTYEASIGAGV